ncbi:Chromate resistance protein ChrB [Paenibacillus sp. MAH-36]|uniref:Chromate resistance protein ChrB n=1 Tax=Paenibacillus violae TaxID=3077234 RepID=A0ABU3RQJ1_9BACL|nr:Chromate resistance protein ChrB [Paenibacillus sp. PFR10]MDU0206371.1 Chromate resistance protein ChrB [Paenibacillus sp. PFR10]
MNWIVFIYKLPSKPTKYRAYVWREIKKYGALYLQDGVCIVPDTDDVQLFIGVLAEKVVEFGGQEFTFHSTTFSKEKDAEMVQQFNETRDAEYRELNPALERMLETLEEEEEWEFSPAQALKVRDDFRKLQRSFQAIEARDYFESESGRRLRLQIDQCRKLLNQRFP